MARVAFTNEKEATGKELEAYLELKNQGKLTNMKEALLQDYATYDAFMGWYTCLLYTSRRGKEFRWRI